MYRRGATVIYESTVYPGATEEVCIPVLEKESGLKWKQDFFVGYSPERINPGDRARGLADIVKVTNTAGNVTMLTLLSANVAAGQSSFQWDVGTLLDGNPSNNFLDRAVTFNPGGVLTGARHVTLAGHNAYITADAGLVVIDLNDPLKPRLAARVPLTVAAVLAAFGYALLAGFQVPAQRTLDMIAVVGAAMR